MVIDGIEQIMNELSSARGALDKRRKAVEEAQQTVAEASKRAKFLRDAARQEGDKLVTPAAQALSHENAQLASAEHRVMKLEELLYVALQTIEQRIQGSS